MSPCKEKTHYFINFHCAPDFLNFFLTEYVQSINLYLDNLRIYSEMFCSNAMVVLHFLKNCIDLWLKKIILHNHFIYYMLLYCLHLGNNDSQFHH